MKRWILIGQNYFPDEGEFFHTFVGIYNSEADLDEARKDNVSKYNYFMPFEIDDPLLNTIHVVIASKEFNSDHPYVEACFIQEENAEKFIENLLKHSDRTYNKWSLSVGDLVG